MPPRVHLINPSELSFGVAVITPRWLYVLAAATGVRWGAPHIVDETLEAWTSRLLLPATLSGSAFIPATHVAGIRSAVNSEMAAHGSS